MCGIFGWVGKNPKKFNKDKFNILGMYNISRGKHSCGVSTDGDIKIGLDDVKLYDDFITKLENPYESPKKIPTVLGHTRQASFGKHTIENAHPFGYGTVDEGFEFIGVHNGTLLDHDKLAKEFKVDLKVTSVNTDKDNVGIREKIDSEILLEILYKNKNFKVLSKYNGAAALMFYNVNEPNVSYFFHGKSKKWNTSTSEEEERPLYYYKETRNSLYVSSIENSLKAISNDYSKIGEFEHNVVYKVTNGDINKAEKIKISRSKCHQKETWSNYHGYGYGNYREYNKNTNSKVKNKNKAKSKSKNKKVLEHNIYNEKPRLNSKQVGKRPYFHKLRWYRNGHTVDGIYVFIHNYGFYYLANDYETAKKEYKDIVGKYFDLDTEEFVTYYIKDSEVPFTDSILTPFKYFYNGIMLRTLTDYKQIISQDMEGKPFSWEQLSHASSHPIININTYNKYDEQQIMWNGKYYTGKIAVMNAFRIYDVNNGNLINMSDMKLPENFYTLDKKKKVILLNENTSSLDKPLIDCDCGDDTCFVCQSDMDDIFVIDTIDQIFEQALSNLPLGKRQLEKFLPNYYAEKAIKVIDDFIDKSLELN